MGLAPEIAASLATVEPQGFPVWPDNMPITDAWLVACTQWRAISMADGRVLWLGLDYTGVRSGLLEAAITLSPSQWAGLRLMERIASSALNGNRT